jgi:hypothetical protein
MKSIKDKMSIDRLNRPKIERRLCNKYFENMGVDGFLSAFKYSVNESIFRFKVIDLLRWHMK